MKLEQKIIDGCRKGDRREWKNLYEALSPEMYKVCLRYSDSIEEAQDTLHDGFVKIFSKITDFRGEGSFEGWVRRIFVTISLEKIRKNAIIRFEGEDKVVDIQNSQYLEILESLSSKEVMNIIENMPQGYKTVLKLYSIEGYSHSEIAEMLEISPETSRSQLARAKQQLKKAILDSRP